MTVAPPVAQGGRRASWATVGKWRLPAALLPLRPAGAPAARMSPGGAAERHGAPDGRAQQARGEGGVRGVRGVRGGGESMSKCRGTTRYRCRTSTDVIRRYRG